jgi:hypothetical protein
MQRVSQANLSWLPQVQILKHLPDFHKTHKEQRATQGYNKTIIFNLFQPLIKTRRKRKLSRWHAQFEKHAIAHRTARLAPHWVSS